MENNIIETIGCDLGDKKSEICVLRRRRHDATWTVRSTRKDMQLFFTRVTAHVVIEVGGHSRGSARCSTDWASGDGGECAAREVDLAEQQQDRPERRRAAGEAGSGRHGLLAPVVHRKPETQAHLAVAKARDVLVATRTKLVNHVRGTVKSFGERIPKCQRGELCAADTRCSIPDCSKRRWIRIYETLEGIDEQIRE